MADTQNPPTSNGSSRLTLPNGDAAPTHLSTPEQIRLEKRRIIKNLLVICVAFLFNFNAFQGLSRLQSSFHRIEGMGVITSSVLYGSLMISCMFAPKILISYIGHKWTIAISFTGYILWMAANGYAV